MAISNILELDNGYYLLQVIDRIESTVPPLEDVKDRVRADLMKIKQNDQAKSAAQAALTELENGKPLVEVAAANHIKAEETGFFSRNATVPQIGYEQEVSRVGFDLSMEKPLARETLQTAKGWLVFSLKERKAPDAAGFEKEKEDIITRLTSQEKQQTLETWLKDLKSRSTITINNELIR